MDRHDIAKRILEYNPDIKGEGKLAYFCTLFERLIQSGTELAPMDTKDQWKEHEVTAKWSTELAQDIYTHGIDVDAELMDIMVFELEHSIPKEFKLGYLKFERAMSTSMNPIMKVSYGGME